MNKADVLNIAHRGARNAAPENTLEAIAKADELGADAVELDAQLSADGAVVVFHDDHLVRCTDAPRRFPARAPWRLCDFDVGELRELDAGGWFVSELHAPPQRRQSWLQDLTDAEREACVRPAELAHYASGAVRVPLLAECLEACKRLGLGVHVELKLIPRFYPMLAEHVVNQIRRAGMQDDAWMSSFDHAGLARIAAVAPDVRAAVLTGDRLHRPAEYLARLGASAYNPGCHGDHDSVGFGAVDGRLDRDTIAGVRAAGYDVFVWTENDPARMARLIEAGVSGIYTDCPNRLRAVIDGRAGRSGPRGGRAHG